MTTVLVVTGGDVVDPDSVADLPPVDFVVAADSGLDHAERLGLQPHLVVGDFDSVSDHALARFPGPVERHPVAKDATDLELALAAAVARRPRRIVVVGGHGGRLDHLIANALVLTTVPPDIDVEWRAGRARIRLCRDSCTISGRPGDLVSLIPVGGDAAGVTTAGLRWALKDSTLESGSTRGISNELVEESASVRVVDGTLLVIAPGQS